MTSELCVKCRTVCALYFHTVLMKPFSTAVLAVKSHVKLRSVPAACLQRLRSPPTIQLFGCRPSPATSWVLLKPEALPFPWGCMLSNGIVAATCLNLGTGVVVPLWRVPPTACLLFAAAWIHAVHCFNLFAPWSWPWLCLVWPGWVFLFVLPCKRYVPYYPVVLWLWSQRPGASFFTFCRFSVWPALPSSTDSVFHRGPNSEGLKSLFGELTP